MSDERDGTTTGFVDGAAPGTGPDQAGATAVPDPRTETRGPRQAQPGPQPGPQPDPQPAGAAPVPPADQPAGPPAAEQARPSAPPGPAGPAGPVGPVGPAGPPTPPPAEQPGVAEPMSERPPGAHPTVPVPVRVRPRPRVPNRDQMIRMGPWAPVAGAALGLLLGIVVVLLLAPAVDSFAERLSLVFVVLGMTLLGAGGTLLADEVRLLRRGTSAIEARNSGAEVVAGLLNGLTPARLLITASAFVLLLSAYVTTRA